MKKKLILALFFLLTLNSCNGLKGFFGSKDIEVATPQYENYKSGFNYVSRQAKRPEDIPDEERDFKLEKSEDYDVTYESVKATGSYEDMCSMGVNNEILYPGALVDTSDGSYRPLQIKRAPITLSTNLESVLNIDTPIATTIDVPSLSNVRQGIRNIVKNNMKDDVEYPSNLSYTIKEITNENELKLNVGFGLQVSQFALQENFSSSNVNKQTNLMFILKQVYYTIDMDAPKEKNSRDLFDSSLSSREINDALEGTIPAYVSSVSYGRIAFVSIQTNYSKDEITNALSISWGKMSQNPGSSSSKKLSVDIDNTITTIGQDTDTTISCYVYGGSSGEIVNLGKDNSSTLQSIFSTFNGSKDGALPISYTMRHLNGELAKVQDCSEYTIKHITYNPKKIMNWSFLDELIKSGELFDKEELTLDFSAMIDYDNPKESSVNANRTIIIPDNIKELTIIGPNRFTDLVEYNNLSFKIDYRSENNPLILNLDSISFNANGEEGTCLSSESNALIHLNVRRSVVLKGRNGCPAIKCSNLLIDGDANFRVYGGDGVNGDDEINNSNFSNNGGTGIDGSKLEINMKGKIRVYGGTGGVGKTGLLGDEELKTNGGIGGIGGNGGAAIVADELIINESSVELFAGNGGQGGTGGKGYNALTGWGWHRDASTGGQGGTGGDSGIIFDVKTVNLNGNQLNVYEGNGGQGGTGGTGGDGEEIDNNYTHIVIDYYQKGKPGTGGNGGNGGNCLKYTYTDELIIVHDGYAGIGGAGGNGGKKWSILHWGGTAGNPNSSAKNGDDGQKGIDGAYINIDL